MGELEREGRGAVGSCPLSPRGPRSNAGIGPDGGKALAALLERLTTLQTLDLRFVEGERYSGWESWGAEYRLGNRQRLGAGRWPSS